MKTKYLPICVLTCFSLILIAGCSKEELNEQGLFSKANSTAENTLTSVTATYAKGVTGHPLRTSSGAPNLAYMELSFDEQISAVNQIGATFYRIGLGSKNNGQCYDATRIHSLVAAANRGHIKLLANVPLTTLNVTTQTEATAYQAGKDLGTAVARQYNLYFDYYEIGNELDNKYIISGSGKNFTDYDTVKMKIAVSYVKGMHDGLLVEDPTAKTMVNAGWVHWGYMDYVVSQTPIEIVAWHWYSDMETNTSGSGTTNIAETLYARYGKPIWFTEINQKNGSAGTYKGVSGEAGQALFFTEFGAKMNGNSHVGALFAYELFDLNEHTDPNERNYGLLKWTTPYSVYEEKEAAEAFRNL